MYTCHRWQLRSGHRRFIPGLKTKSRKNCFSHFVTGVAGLSFHSMSCCHGCRLRVKNMFYHAYNGYLNHAHPFDELRPITCDGHDTWGRYSSRKNVVIARFVSTFKPAYNSFHVLPWNWLSWLIFLRLVPVSCSISRGRPYEACFFMPDSAVVLFNATYSLFVAAIRSLLSMPWTHWQWWITTPNSDEWRKFW